ncbi:DUF6915 family protein [Spirochaeta dissipatitropha]
MPSFEYHCQESQRLFGNPYPEVHRWLDEFAGQAPYGMRHRFLRHHEEGIRQAAEQFGLEAAAVARQHIISDLKQEGWTESDPFPKNSDHYKRIGLY